MKDYGLKIGMSIDALKNVENSQATDESNELLFKFCEHDLDRKISDQAELYLFNSWLSGETKVKMPEFDDMEQELSSFRYSDSVCITRNNKSEYSSSVSINKFGLVNGELKLNATNLYDFDNDGYVDTYDGMFNNGVNNKSTFTFNFQRNITSWDSYDYNIYNSDN